MGDVKLAMIVSTKMCDDNDDDDEQRYNTRCKWGSKNGRLKLGILPASPAALQSKSFQRLVP